MPFAFRSHAMQLAELTQPGGYQGIAYSEFLYWSSLAARPRGSDGVRAQLTGVTVVRQLGARHRAHAARQHAVMMMTPDCQLMQSVHMYSSSFNTVEILMVDGLVFAAHRRKLGDSEPLLAAGERACGQAVRVQPPFRGVCPQRGCRGLLTTPAAIAMQHCSTVNPP